MKGLEKYMMPKSLLRRVGKMVAAIAIAVPLMMPAVAQAPALAMLDGLERGLWEIRFRDGTAPQNLCVRSGHEFVQLRHSGANCNRIVIEDAADEVTVQYTCRGNGYGRTNIRRESRSLVQIEAQGIAGSKAFEFTAEARRTGNCR